MRFSLITIFLFTYFLSSAQKDGDHIAPIFDITKDRFTEEYYFESEFRVNSASTDPPEGPLRTMAEWEELQAVVISWIHYPSILTELVRHIKEETTVIIVCSNIEVVKNTLTNSGVDISSNIRFVLDEFDSVWVRDYGPNSVYMNDVDSLILVDWIYNRPWRPNDDAVPEGIAEDLNLPLFATVAEPYRFVATGGNFMSDGLGSGFSSNLILDENSNDTILVDKTVMDFMGIDEYVKFVNLPYDKIHHIDMHMKLIDEQTILVGEYPEGVADGPQIEANLQYFLNNFTTHWGEKYKVVRIPMPPDAFGRYPDHFLEGHYRTYANALFANKMVLVPTYEEKYDTTALRIWEEIMPGYNIVGVDCNLIIPASGALHCITKEVGVNDPLRIVHRKEECIADLINPLKIQATIQHHSGIAEARLFYKTNLESDFTELELILLQGDLWEASIPAPDSMDSTSELEYYFAATSNSGKHITRPIVAPEGTFKVSSCGIMVSNTNNVSVESKILDVFPNPANSITCIPIELNNDSNIRLSLQDVMGKEVNTIFDGRGKAGNSKYFFNAQDFTSGVYYLRLQGENSSTVQKILIQ